MNLYTIRAKRLEPNGAISLLSLLIPADNIPEAIQKFMEKENIKNYFNEGSFSIMITPGILENPEIIIGEN